MNMQMGSSAPVMKKQVGDYCASILLRCSIHSTTAANHIQSQGQYSLPSYLQVSWNSEGPHPDFTQWKGGHASRVTSSSSCLPPPDPTDQQQPSLYPPLPSSLRSSFKRSTRRSTGTTDICPSISSLYHTTYNSAITALRLVDAPPALLIEAIPSESSTGAVRPTKKQVAYLNTIDLTIHQQSRTIEQQQGDCGGLLQQQTLGYHLVGLIEEQSVGEVVTSHPSCNRYLAIVSCKHGDQKQWFRIDGQDINLVSEPEVIAAQACMLLYVRNDFPYTF